MARPRESTPNAVSDAVRQLRKRVRLTQQEFAEWMDVAITTVARWETTRPPSRGKLAVLRLLAQGLGEYGLAGTFGKALAAELNVPQGDIEGDLDRLAPENRPRRQKETILNTIAQLDKTVRTSKLLDAETRKKLCEKADEMRDILRAVMAEAKPTEALAEADPDCAKCHGTGWDILQGRGVANAEHCDCTRRTNDTFAQSAGAPASKKQPPSKAPSGRRK
jgi:transcriptional regulator with XRE-family HTH domain